MRLEVVEHDSEKLKVALVGESQTLTQLLATQIWENGSEAAALHEHPFMEEPKILVVGPNPKKLLEKAAASIQEQCEEFKSEFQKALKK